MQCNKLLFAATLFAAASAASIPAQADHRDYRDKAEHHRKYDERRHHGHDRHEPKRYQRDWHNRGHHASRHGQYQRHKAHHQHRKHVRYDGKIRGYHYRQRGRSIEIYDRRHRVVQRIPLRHASHWNIRKGRLFVHYPHKTRVYGGKHFQLLSTRRHRQYQNDWDRVASGLAFWLRL